MLETDLHGRVRLYAARTTWVTMTLETDGARSATVPPVMLVTSAVARSTESRVRVTSHSARTTSLQPDGGCSVVSRGDARLRCRRAKERVWCIICVRIRIDHSQWFSLVRGSCGRHLSFPRSECLGCAYALRLVTISGNSILSVVKMEKELAVVGKGVTARLARMATGGILGQLLAR